MLTLLRLQFATDYCTHCAMELKDLQETLEFWFLSSWWTFLGCNIFSKFCCYSQILHLFVNFDLCQNIWDYFPSFRNWTAVFLTLVFLMIVFFPWYFCMLGCIMKMKKNQSVHWKAGIPHNTCHIIPTRDWHWNLRNK